MKKIRIITDSAADMDSAENAHLTVLPITINFGVTAYQDGVTLSRHDFYAKLIEQDELPITSQITPYAFEDAIRTAKESGETVIIITMASKLSGTHNSAVLAASDFDDVYVVDSESVCVGQRILVEYALRLVEEGTSAAAIVEMLEVARKNIRVIALLDTLEYLRRGGRISKVTGFVGGILSIKPVVAIENGEVVLLGKARGSQRQQPAQRTNQENRRRRFLPALLNRLHGDQRRSPAQICRR